MTDQTEAVAAQGEADAEAQGAQTPPAQGAEPQTAQGASGEGGTVTVETLTRKVAELEADNRKYRMAAKQREDAERQSALASLTETERLRAENQTLSERVASLEGAAKEQSLRLASQAAAARLGFRDPDLAYRLLDSGAVTFEDDGTPKGVDKALEAVAKAHPYLLAQTDFGGGNRGSSVAASGTDMNALIRGAVRRS